MMVVAAEEAPNGSLKQTSWQLPSDGTPAKLGAAVHLLGTLIRSSLVALPTTLA